MLVEAKDIGQKYTCCSLGERREPGDRWVIPDTPKGANTKKNPNGEKMPKEFNPEYMIQVKEKGAKPVEVNDSEPGNAPAPPAAPPGSRPVPPGTPPGHHPAPPAVNPSNKVVI